jgi:hypothetical protein
MSENIATIKPRQVCFDERLDSPFRDYIKKLSVIG